MRYGSSPDAVGPLGILLEVKRRAEVSLSPLESLDIVPQYFMQCQLQMLCTDVEFFVLQSYHPTSIFITVKGNNTLTTIIKQLTDCILDNNYVLNWTHTGVSELHVFATGSLGKVPTFQLPRSVRTYIKKCTKLIPQIKFVDEFDF